MRDILFRSWHEASKKYFNWDDFSINGRNNCIIHITEGVFETNGSPNQVVLEQYAGLEDKNGKKIFEGDILNDNGCIMLVRWNKKFASFSLEKNGWLHSHFFSEASDPEDCEIIGNIHQNPELLK